MLTPVKGAVCLLLFLLAYLSVSRLIMAAVGGFPAGRTGRKFRWRAGRHGWHAGRNFRRRAGRAVWRHADGTAGRQAGWADRRSAGSGTGRPAILPAGRNALAERLHAADAGLAPAGFAALSALLGAAGLAAGAVVFGNVKGMLVPAGLLFLLPSLWLRSRLASRRLKRRKDLLPALETVYQGYVLSPGRNIRVALRHAVESGRLPRHAQPVFERLHAGLTVHWDPEDALRLFTASFASRWADLFARLLQSALEDGTDAAEGMRELIADMRRAQRNDQAERNRLLEIRLANVSPLLFLAVFLAVNVRMDPAMAYRYYVLSDAGKDMLLDALVMVGLSFAAGASLSLRKE